MLLSLFLFVLFLILFCLVALVVLYAIFPEYFFAMFDKIWHERKEERTGKKDEEEEGKEDNEEDSGTTVPNSAEPSASPAVPQPSRVFHIEENIYTYPEAKCKCASYGGTLATKKQLEDAFESGAHWCNYGWSAGQTVYFPLQKHKWENMTNKEREMCGGSEASAVATSGKGGLMGGLVEDDTVRFGVNCYGPVPSNAEDTRKEDEESKTCANLGPHAIARMGDSLLF